MTNQANIQYYLHGLRVLVTRPRPTGEILCEHINAAGGESIYFPTVNIVPIADAGIANRQIAKIDRQDWLIFISASAVTISSDMIKAFWPHFPAHLKVAAVGTSTAKVLESVGLPLHVFPKEQWSSEGLLLLPEFQQIEGKKITIIRGEGGHDWLAQSLKMRGALISHIIVYRREIPELDVTGYLDLLANNQIDAMVGTSGEVIRNLKELLKSAWSKLESIPLVVISPRTQVIAKDLGFKTILLAKNASHNAIMAVLDRYANHKK